jgi:hypothetical protein
VKVCDDSLHARDNEKAYEDSLHAGDWFQTNVVLKINTENGEITRLCSDGLPETPPEKRRFTTVMPQVKVSAQSRLL